MIKVIHHLDLLFKPYHHKYFYKLLFLTIFSSLLVKKMNHRIYGIILFSSIVILIYLLNKKNGNKNQGVYELFSDVPSIVDEYTLYNNARFSIDEGTKNISLESALKLCSNNNYCQGVSMYKGKTDNDNVYFQINNVDFCRTKFQGSDYEKDTVKDYSTYIKNSVNNRDYMCLTNDNLINKKISIYGYDNTVWSVVNNRIELVKLAKISVSKTFQSSIFKIVQGFYGNNTVSIMYEVDGFPPYYIVNEYPKKGLLHIKNISSNASSDIKKSASFKIIGGLSKPGISIKILGFTNMYIVGSGETPNVLNILPIELTDSDNKMKATFNFGTIVSEDLLNSKDLDSTIPKDDSDVAILTPDEKNKKMRGKNLYTLEKQNYLLDNQSNMINAFDFVHKNNLNYIGREFALQSANLALSKYLQEKDDMSRLQENNSSTVNTSMNTPSVATLKP